MLVLGQGRQLGKAECAHGVPVADFQGPARCAREVLHFRLSGSLIHRDALRSGIHPPEVSEPAHSEPPERIIAASRAEILRVAEGKLGELGEYSEKMERSLRAAIERRAERETEAAGAEAAQARSETLAAALAETERLRARLRAA